MATKQPTKDTKFNDKESDEFVEDDDVEEIEEIDDIESDNISLHSDDNNELEVDEVEDIPNIENDNGSIYPNDNKLILDKDEEELEENYNENNKFVKPEERITTKYLINYERVRLLGTRVSQLSQGAKPMINNVTGMDPKIIAQLELECGMIPIKILRTLPNKRQEIWKLSELKLKSSYIIYGFTGKEDDIIKSIKNN